MDPTWLTSATLDATWPGVLAVLGTLGIAATAVVLARQATPRTRTDAERVARRRERFAR